MYIFLSRFRVGCESLVALRESDSLSRLGLYEALPTTQFRSRKELSVASCQLHPETIMQKLCLLSEGLQPPWIHLLP